MAGRIPDTFIQDLLARTDLVELIDARVPLKRSGSNYTARCPFHNEKTPSFSVSGTKQLYYCFGCGARGTAISFLMDYDRLSFPEAIEALAEIHGLEIPRESGEGGSKVSQDHVRSLYDALERASKYYQQQLRSHPDASAAIDYLRGRGVTGEVAQRFQLGFAPGSLRNLSMSDSLEVQKSAGLVHEKTPGRIMDWFRERIMFPIRDRRGRTIGFGGRVMGDGQPKYLNSPETEVFHKHREVYGLYELLEAVKKPEAILVVEGYMDVIALSQYGVQNAVAALGTATSPDHVSLLFRYCPVIVFCFDGDAAGRRAAWKALESSLAHLREGRQVRFLMLPEGHDPDSLVRQEGPEAFRTRILEAQPFSDYFFEQLAIGLELTTIEGRAALSAKAQTHLEKIQPGVFREMLQDRLDQLTGRGDRVDLRGSGDPRPVAPSPRATRGQPSAFRTFLALLIQNPSLVDHLDTRMLAILVASHSHGGVLKSVVEFLMSHPHVTPAGLIEGMREHPEGDMVARLAAWDPQVADDSLESLFCDYLKHLTGERSRESRLKVLIDRARGGVLSAEEREEMRALTQSSDH
jgi:DNA primase